MGGVIGPVAQALLPVLFIERSIAEEDFSRQRMRITRMTATVTGSLTTGPLYLAISRFCANGHSRSIH